MFELLPSLLEERVDGPVGRTVEEHLAGLADGPDLLGAADGGECRPVDGDRGTGEFLHEFARAAVLADQSALLAAQVVLVSRRAVDIDDLEHHHIVVEETERLLGGEPAADRPDDVGAFQPLYRVTDLLDADVSGLGVDVEAYLRALLDIAHRLSTLPDENPDAVVGYLHVLHTPL